MNPPIYHVGQPVLHTCKGVSGTVVAMINASDPSDIRLQGYRYLIRHSGWLWSVPERSLAQLEPTVSRLCERVRGTF